MENKKDFFIKHREDVIDTLHLRAKEKKVLYGLLLILLLTIAYEHGGQIMGYLLTEDFNAPALGKRTRAVIKTDQIKEMSKKVADIKNILPQFGHLVSEYQLRLGNALTLSKDPQKTEEATMLVLGLSEDLYRFVTHPVMPEADELEELKNYLEKLQKKFRLVFNTEFEIKPVHLVKSEATRYNKISRSLFQYENF